MEMTIKEYCEKKQMNIRYIQQLIKNEKSELLRTKWGIVHFRKFGNTYALTVDEKHITNDKNK